MDITVIMKLKLFVLLISAVVFGQNNSPIYLNPSANVDSRVADLMSRMTLEEKVGQMCQYVGIDYLKKQQRNKKASGDLSKLNKDAFAMYSLSESEITQEIIDGKICSFLHVLDPKEVNYLHDITITSTLINPLTIHIDAIN